MEIKYRICKNKYDYFKIQRYDRSLELKRYRNPFKWFYDLCFGSILEWKYEWRDTYGQRVYETEELAIKRVDYLVEKDETRRQKSNNEWECQGEY